MHFETHSKNLLGLNQAHISEYRLALAIPDLTQQTAKLTALASQLQKDYEISQDFPFE